MTADASFNELLRSTARGHTRERTRDQPGNIGIGKGGAAAVRAPRANEAINAAIREAAHVATNRVHIDGVDLNEVLDR
jgi:hypothetical protein